VHGPNQHLVSAQQLGKSRVGREAPVEVGAQRNHDDRSTLGIGDSAGEGVREGGALDLGAAGGVELFELVDGEE
jgi:hypothetical protein